MRSLRTKLVVFSTLISGLIIIGLGCLSWISTAGSFRRSIDLQLKDKVGRIMRDLHPRLNEDQLRSHLQINFGDEIKEGLRLVRVMDEVNKKVLFEGPANENWLDGTSPIFRQPEHDLPSRPEREGGPHLPKHGNGEPPHRNPPPDGEGHPPPERQKKPPPPDEKQEQITHFESTRINGDHWRLAIKRQRGYSVLLGLELSRAQAELNQLGTLYLVAIPIALGLIALCGWLVANRVLRPLRIITETASHISAEDLSERIPESPHTDSETAELTRVLNNMIDRLQKSFSLANRFSADVSHELKTPIAIMQGEVESALKDCGAESKQRRNLRVIREEIQRLKAITSQLMLLAQADIGQLIRKMEVFDLSEEVTAIAEDGNILAMEANVTLVSKIEAKIEIKGDAVLIRQALLNLVVNAIKYNHPGGELRISLSRKEKNKLLIAVENTGPGIPAEDRERVFHRFHRGDKSRSREVEGFGLGLCLALEIVRGHLGDLKLTRANEEVTRFEVTLPTA